MPVSKMEENARSKKVLFDARFVKGFMREVPEVPHEVNNRLSSLLPVCYEVSSATEGDLGDTCPDKERGKWADRFMQYITYFLCCLTVLVFTFHGTVCLTCLHRRYGRCVQRTHVRKNLGKAAERRKHRYDLRIRPVLFSEGFGSGTLRQGSIKGFYGH